MPFAISFVGHHDSGKTSLAVEVARLLLEEGIRIGVLKSSKEERPHLERDFSDTNLFWQTGVAKVAFWGRKEGFLRFFVPEKDEFRFWYFVNRFFPEEDLVICEGFKKIQSLPKIEVWREGPEEPLFRRGVPGILAVVSEARLETPCPLLPPDPRIVASFIKERLPKKRPSATLLVDGRPVGLTRFVSRALSESVKGFLRSLRGVNNPKLIELRIESRED
ncbi:MAG: hypothetical protein GXO20_07590 [Thermodesulfobacteria bacterium]|nr:hypothetical protein [Thermodesulfobacteriota bacterium]